MLNRMPLNEARSIKLLKITSVNPSAVDPIPANSVEEACVAPQGSHTGDTDIKVGFASFGQATCVSP